MCTFITALLPPRSDIEAVALAPRRHKLGWEPITTGGVVAQLRPGETYFLTTTGMCDCGTALGSAGGLRRDFSRQIAKLERKGWSSAKIQRWLDDKTRKLDRRRSGFHGGETDRWQGFLREVHAEGSAPWVGVLVHVYRGRVDSERVALRDRVRVHLGELGPEVFSEMEPDTFYLFVP